MASKRVFPEDDRSMGPLLEAEIAGKTIKLAITTSWGPSPFHAKPDRAREIAAYLLELANVIEGLHEA